MKKTPLRKGNSKLLQKSSLQTKGKVSLKKTSKINKNPEKQLKKQTVKVSSLYKNLNNYIETHDWKNLRLIGLDLFSKVVFILANGKCQKCGKIGTDAHHWCYTKSHNSITDITPLNGILLCRKCHGEAHENFNLFKEKVSNLPRYQNVAEQLKQAVNKPIDFNLVENIIRMELQMVEDNQDLLKKRKGEDNGTKH